SPATPANSSAASAPPAQLETPRLGSPFHSDQRCSKASSLAPSDHCSESSTSVQSSNNLARSRWSNPIANLVASGRTFSAGPTAGSLGWLASCGLGGGLWVGGPRSARKSSSATGAEDEEASNYRPVSTAGPLSILSVRALQHGADGARARQQHHPGEREQD